MTEAITISAFSPPAYARPTRVSKDKDKKICDWSKKELRERFDELATMIDAPRFVCPKCGRAANEKRWLCKAKAIT